MVDTLEAEYHIVMHMYDFSRNPFDGQILTNGGRVLGVSALGDSLSDASSAAYKACDMIQWKNKYCRTDIGRQS